MEEWSVGGTETKCVKKLDRSETPMKNSQSFWNQNMTNCSLGYIEFYASCFWSQNMTNCSFGFYKFIITISVVRFWVFFINFPINKPIVSSPNSPSEGSSILGIHLTFNFVIVLIFQIVLIKYCKISQDIVKRRQPDFTEKIS